MPGTAQFLDSLRADMDRLIPGSSKGLNAAMRDAVHGTANRFHFTETGADGVTYEVGTAYTKPRAVVHSSEMVLK
jgi:isocitrate dehydrogenase